MLYEFQPEWEDNMPNKEGSQSYWIDLLFLGSATLEFEKDVWVLRIESRGKFKFEHPRREFAEKRLVSFLQEQLFGILKPVGE